MQAVWQGQNLDAGTPQARGHLQSQLAHLLSGCPDAIIIVEGLQQMHPGLLPIWINGLSEQVLPSPAGARRLLSWSAAVTPALVARACV